MAVTNFNWTIVNAGATTVTATEFLNATTALPNSVTSTGRSPVEVLYVEGGHMVELKVNGFWLPPGLTPADVIYRFGNAPPSPTGNFGPAAAAAPKFTPVFPEPVPMLIVTVGIDLNADGVISENEETHKLEIRRLDFEPGDLEVKAQRVFPTPLAEGLFPVKAGEMFETGGLMMDTSVNPPAPWQARFVSN